MPMNDKGGIDNIQDDEDIYDRIRVKQLLKKKKKKKKEKVNQQAYDELDGNIPSLLHKKVQLMESRIQHKNDIRLVSPDMKLEKYNRIINLGLEDRINICSVILNKFESYDFSRIATFKSDLQIHQFRLFVYCVMFSQEEHFQVEDIQLYASVFETLRNLEEQNKQFRGKFTSTSTFEDSPKEIQLITTNRTVEKVEIPPIILKRLNIQ